MLKLILVYLLIIPLSVSAQFSSDEKRIEGVNILLDASQDVKVTPFSGNFALQSGPAKELEESTVTSTELGFVSGVTSSIQTQLDEKIDIPAGSIAGDILYYNGANWTRLASGTPGFVLTVTGSGIPNWLEGGDTSPTTTAGDLIYNDAGGSGTDTRLGIGSDGDVLTVSSGLPVWGPPAVSVPTTTKGDLSTHDGTDPARLPVGSDNQYLVADSSEPTGLKWEDFPQGQLDSDTDNSLWSRHASNGAIQTQKYTGENPYTCAAPSPTGTYTCDHSGLGLSAIPTVQCNVQDASASQSYNCDIDNTTTTSFQVVITDVNNNKINRAFTIFFGKTESDVNKGVSVLPQRWECQTKNLQADAVVSGVLSDLQFNNLTIGKQYQLILNPYFDNDTIDNGMAFDVYNGATLVSRVVVGQDTTNRVETRLSRASYFTATSTTNTAELFSFSAGNILRGDAVTEETSITLCELPDNYIINSTKFN